MQNLSLSAIQLFTVLFGHGSLKDFSGITTPKIVREFERSCTVLITGNHGPNASFGAGVLISTNGYILTADHVLDMDPGSLRVHFRDFLSKNFEERMNDAIPLTIVKRARGVDSALVKIPSNSVPDFASHCQFSINEDVTSLSNQEPMRIYGHPNRKGDITPFDLIEGNFSGYARSEGFADDIFVADAETFPGNSGGPLFYGNSKLAGIQFWNPDHQTYATPMCALNSHLQLQDQYLSFDDHDPEYYRQYHFHVHLLDHIAGTGRGIRIGVIDGGFIKHSDLQGAISFSEGLNFNLSSPTPMTEIAPFHHTTLVNGVIAARKNGIGIEGVAPLASIVPAQAFDDKTGEAHARAIRHLRDLNVDIILIEEAEVGGTIEIQKNVLEEIKAAVKDGVHVVIPAGQNEINNELLDELQNDSGAVIVAGPSPISNWGTRIDVVGMVGATTAKESDGVEHYPVEGAASSSLAAAMVTGVIARILETNPELSPHEMRQLLRRSGQRLFMGKKDLGTFLDGEILSEKLADRLFKQ